jgi:hypothetical protein
LWSGRKTLFPHSSWFVVWCTIRSSSVTTCCCWGSGLEIFFSFFSFHCFACSGKNLRLWLFQQVNKQAVSLCWLGWSSVVHSQVGIFYNLRDRPNIRVREFIDFCWVLIDSNPANAMRDVTSCSRSSCNGSKYVNQSPKVQRLRAFFTILVFWGLAGRNTRTTKLSWWQLLEISHLSHESISPRDDQTSSLCKGY